MSQIAIPFSSWLVLGPALLCGAAALTAGLIVLLRPWLARYALARPSARGLHSVPTPQGGGIAVLVATALAAGIGAQCTALLPGDATRLGAVLAAAAVLAVLGLIDDIRPLPALPRLVVQLACMAVGVWMLPEGTRLFGIMPLGLERALLVLAGAWFINLTNFMDGMDWLTVAELVPISCGLAMFWATGLLPVVPGLLALGLLGGLAGYAPFNKPPARLFLGDVGSLPLGFLTAYGLFALGGSSAAGGGALAGAIILPLYYIADSGLTLVGRLRRREAVWTPHRSHFYQVAAQRDGVWSVLGRVGVTNAVLLWLGIVSVVSGFAALGVAALAMAVAVVAFLLLTLSGRGRDASAGP
ncbi:glycosyl transferase [Lichenihabitans sp. Uapishka_5]|uniref:glycosyl transferase n=1 Tax=Lichenihabitans sp. Uapishka_5 TaxID=3037302 RepID=UPI0029E7D325|nr:glycosyl transferase [Lichenihabitans sp. Uapishka_5]MDX7951131.1 glycosyl transferase [Lichenihabitans sp. Uapishka_5]